VNNSLVLVDFVNQRLAAGSTLLEAAREAGLRRFQPILLTSITTFVGLAPMIFDRSIEAQFLIPMAVSMGFGILFTTVITLFLVPCALLFAQDVADAVLQRRPSPAAVARTNEPTPSFLP
jgi:multidrug efflux pump subunit AcrB